MVRSQSFKKLLEIKRRKFFEAVYRICKKRNFLMPSINFEGCDKGDEDHLAHYHPETNTICVSERQLIMLDFEDIEEVAAHEVSHILVQDHGSAFRTEEALSSIAGWKPESGVIVINGGKKDKKSKKYIKPRIDKIRCNYHLCRKKRKLTHCKYCKNYYCEEHIKPYEPRVYSYRKHHKTKEGHPCLPYVDYLIKKEEENKEKKKKELNAWAEFLRKFSKKYKYKIKTKIIKVSVKRFFFIPINDLVVCLMKNKTFKKTTTNDSGIAAFYDLKEGEYTVAITYNGRLRTKKVYCKNDVNIVSFNVLF